MWRLSSESYFLLRLPSARRRPINVQPPNSGTWFSGRRVYPASVTQDDPSAATPVRANRAPPIVVVQARQLAAPIRFTPMGSSRISECAELDKLVS
jgi:hypothetical protein